MNESAENLENLEITIVAAKQLLHPCIQGISSCKQEHCDPRNSSQTFLCSLSPSSLSFPHQFQSKPFQTVGSFSLLPLESFHTFSLVPQNHAVLSHESDLYGGGPLFRVMTKSFWLIAHFCPLASHRYLLLTHSSGGDLSSWSQFGCPRSHLVPCQNGALRCPCPCRITHRPLEQHFNSSLPASCPDPSSMQYETELRNTQIRTMSVKDPASLLPSHKYATLPSYMAIGM